MRKGEREREGENCDYYNLLELCNTINSPHILIGFWYFFVFTINGREKEREEKTMIQNETEVMLSNLIGFSFIT